MAMQLQSVTRKRQTHTLTKKELAEALILQFFCNQKERMLEYAFRRGNFQRNNTKSTAAITKKRLLFS
ncbi:hypothetical protein CXR57_06270 [Listeria monocytogenes]|nr:hypothetical protein [Listeria monocytogenes]